MPSNSVSTSNKSCLIFVHSITEICTIRTAINVAVRPQNSCHKNYVCCLGNCVRLSLDFLCLINHLEVCSQTVLYRTVQFLLEICAIIICRLYYLNLCANNLMQLVLPSVFVTTLMAPRKLCPLCSSQAGCLDNCALALLALSRSISQQE